MKSKPAKHLKVPDDQRHDIGGVRLQIGKATLEGWGSSGIIAVLLFAAGLIAIAILGLF